MVNFVQIVQTLWDRGSTQRRAKSSFQAAPHRGHLQCLQCICRYPMKMKNATLRFQVHEPDYSSDLPDKQYDWASTYGRYQSFYQAMLLNHLRSMSH